MSQKQATCPACESPYGYDLNEKWNCPECAFVWESESVVEGIQALDSNGNLLHDGDNVIVIKDLPVKGAPKPVKAGTMVRKIRLVDGDHNISCKIDGFGAMGLKSEFVKKA